MEMKNVVNVEGNELTIREGIAASVYEYGGFQHRAYSTDSFIKLVNAKADKLHCVIAYHDTGMKAILNDTVVDRDQDTVSYEFRKSLQYLEWKEILEGVVMTQKGFIKFLQSREKDEIDIELLLFNVQNFKYVTNIEGDFSQADHNNYTFMIKSKDGEGKVKIPQFLYPQIEIFNESGFMQTVEVELEVYRPKDPTEVPGFKFTCPKLARYLKKAVEHEIETMRTGLPDYLIINGSI